MIELPLQFSVEIVDGSPEISHQTSVWPSISRSIEENEETVIRFVDPPVLSEWLKIVENRP
jgi:hypothetical protein